MKTKRYQIAKWDNKKFIAKVVCSFLIELYEIVDGKQKYIADFKTFAQIENEFFPKVN